VVVSPNNPTGAFLKAGELAAIDGMCAAHGIALVVDEVFCDYPAGDDPRRVAGAAGRREALTFVLNGLSKMSGLPQVKLGWILAAGPERLRREAVERLAYVADAYLSVGTPVQHAAPVLLAQRGSIAAQVRGRLARNAAALDAACPPGCRVLRREGGWYAVLRLPDDASDEETAISLLQRDAVLVHPGYFYDFPGDAPYLVLSLLPRPDVFAEGAARLGRALA
jgi:aspartate/methionine/tyrosine aminotransferase